MGIFDQFYDNAKSSSKDEGNSSATSSNLFGQFYGSTKEKPKGNLIPAGAPVGGEVEYITPEELNKRANAPKNGGRDFPSLTEAVGKRVKEGTDLIGEGVSDIAHNKPASGIGKVGLGALSIPGSLATGPADVVDKVTGSDIGNRALMVLPVAPSSKAVKAVVPSNKAFKDLVEMVGPENAGYVAKEMRADPRLTPADLSPAVKSATQKLFTVEGDKAKNHIAGYVEKRAGEAKAAVDEAMNSSLGTAVDPVQKLNELKSNIRNVGKTQIQPVIENAKPVDLTDTIAHIDAQLKPGISSVISSGQLPPTSEAKKALAGIRKLITDDKSTVIDAKSLNEFQSVLRGEAENLIKKGGNDARTGYALAGVRNQIVSAIDNATGGAYKPALSKYRDEYHIQDAFTHGHDAILKNGRDIESNPAFFKDWYNKATDAEKQAAKEGARIAIDQAIKGFRSPPTNEASKAIQMAQVDFNRERIETLFGKEEAGKLFKKLENERKIAETNSDLIRNSQTAMRSAADSRVALPTKTDVIGGLIPPAALETASMLTTGTPGIASAAYAGARALTYGKDKIATALAKEKNAQLAKYALPSEGPSRDELIRNLEAVAQQHSTPKLSIMNKARMLVSP
jgi:hypothetical protein